MSLMMPVVGWRPSIGGNDAYTVLLLHCNGADGSTTITDSSAAAHSATPQGNAQIDTAQSKFGGASLLLDGTSDYLSLDGSSDFAFGTGDFAIDFWFRAAGFSTQPIVYSTNPGTSGATIDLYFSASGVPALYVNNGVRITGSTACSTGTWYHLALTRAGGSTRLFLNGSQEGSTWADSTNYSISTGRPYLGTGGAAPTTYEFNGWLDEIRVSKGTARWAGAFTPPAQAYS